MRTKIEMLAHRCHRALTRARVPDVPLEGGLSPDAEERTRDLLDRLAERVESLSLYMRSLRRKWLREKKKSVAANLALENYRRGVTKTWKAKHDALETQIANAVEIFRKTHKPITSTMGGHGHIAQLVTYLVDRSNQLFANDSAALRQAETVIKTEKLKRAEAETKTMTLERQVQWYQQRFGRFDPDGELMSQMDSMPKMMAEADSFPWKRGNPGYLGDYSTLELVNEVESRVADIEHSNRLLKDDIERLKAVDTTTVPPRAHRPRCLASTGKDETGYLCDLVKGHAGAHATSVGAGRVTWATGYRAAPDTLCGDKCVDGLATYYCKLAKGHAGAHAENIGGMTNVWRSDATKA